MADRRSRAARLLLRVPCRCHPVLRATYPREPDRREEHMIETATTERPTTTGSDVVPTHRQGCGFTVAIDQLDDQDSRPTRYQVLTSLGCCPSWCELPADHDIDTDARIPRAAVYQLDDRVHVSVCETANRTDAFPATTIEIDFVAHGSFSREEALDIERALGAAFERRDEILAGSAVGAH